MVITKISLFTKEQKQAIILFLSYCAELSQDICDCDIASKALSYWKNKEI